ncbi:hypothetical protein SKAU_G00105130 [Synaphobranchus kaupii]|uniref:Uncharacterized protein n=1 Tax=Synaphobranchus kaupii TaxID=118154 RepID=A0A9Q1J5N4_SYNKA|nr:hypothetical protein SKAU_G00105130 [Synaphobranchus kaupii]
MDGRMDKLPRCADRQVELADHCKLSVDGQDAHRCCSGGRGPALTWELEFELRTSKGLQRQVRLELLREQLTGPAGDLGHKSMAKLITTG